VRELQFLAVNSTHALAPYRQAALWLRDGGVVCLSGVVQIEANVPYVLWLQAICAQLAEAEQHPRAVDSTDFPGPLGEAWGDWLPEHVAWLPLNAPAEAAGGDAQPMAGGLLLARDEAWTEQELVLLGEWVETWAVLWRARQPAQGWHWRQWRTRLREGFRRSPGKRWWHVPATRWALGLLLVLCLPVRLTVLAPGELVPARPAVIRAPLEGVIDTFHVQPNQLVKKDQPLFGFDEALIQSRLEVSRQALATAEAEYRQAAQQALTDAKSKAQLALLTGKIEEKRAEAAFLADQLTRARVLAPQDGIALFDDPSEWIGKPVGVGERIMRIASPDDVEVEAWVPLADAIPLPEEAGVSLYLNASPLSPVDARLRYLAHDAVERPDGNYAYRLRATLTAPTEHRVGLKGTARLQGHQVPMAYWVLRRPLAGIRAYLGW
jgi:hypothetical protein